MIACNSTMTLLRCFLFLLLLPWATGAWAAAADQDVQVLRQQSTAWLEQLAGQTWPGVRARIEVGSLDPRLRLPACRDLRFAPSAGSRLSNTGSLRLQCLAPARWSLYLGYKMQLTGPALVARRNLAARQIVTGADLETRNIDYEFAPAAYLVDSLLRPGARCNRPIRAGQPVLAEWLLLPPAVSAGQNVRLVVEGAGFSVNQEGSALNTAAVGEPVRVKTRAGLSVQGIAQEDGSVLVRP